MQPNHAFLGNLAVSSGICYFSVCREDETDADYLLKYSEGDWFEENPVTSGITAMSLMPDSSQIAILSRLDRTVAILPDGGIETIPNILPGRRSLTELRRVGAALYACGMKGQVLRRSDDGQWSPLASDFAAKVQSFDEHSYIATLGGPSEKELYLASRDGCLFWNGRTLVPVGPKTSQITDVFVEDERTIWLCGWKGVLLRGNYVDGFTLVDNSADQMFLSLTKIEDRLCLGATMSFWAYDGRTIGPEKLDFPNVPDRITKLSVANGVVWASGGSAILRHNDEGWRRLR